MKPLLKVDRLAVGFHTPHGMVKAVDEVSFTLDAGETLGIVGESGCGKSVTAHALMKLVAVPPGKYLGGTAEFDGRDVLTLDAAGEARLRGKEMAMIFQDPMTALNPVLTIGEQIIEGIRRHDKVSAAEARKRAAAMLELVGIAGAEERLSAYPHQFSGGMRQRAMIAMALSCQPRLLIADEPTTALDVTVQAQILQLLNTLQSKLGTAILFISHDFGVVAEVCRRVLVMYAGRVVESGPTEMLFSQPCHPYTRGLLQSVPQLEWPAGEKLAVIGGQPPNLLRLPQGCAFWPRCAYALEICRRQAPIGSEVGPGRQVSCWRWHEAAPRPW